METDLQDAIDNIEIVVTHFINNPPEGWDINKMVRDYNAVRQAVTTVLVDRDVVTKSDE